MFGAQKAFIVSSLGAIYHSIYELDTAVGEISSELSAVEEYCYRTIIDRDEVHGVSISLPQQLIDNGEKHSSIAYNGRMVRQYLGAPLLVSGNKCGVLCFLTTSNSEPSHLDTETLDLMAEGVARMIEINNTQEKNRIEEIRGYASSGVKSLDEYIGHARLPEVYGVSGRGVEVLQRRIGKKPLAIDFIAEELNLSKRTLQRRLQQQYISCAQLRDQVRFHYSIDYLVRQTLSIDGISMALDFSDRTSFTNAFKRWTNLSPSTFRKLFRDYV
jgi:AraC-like DNA-binding protein